LDQIDEAPANDAMRRPDPAILDNPTQCRAPGSSRIGRLPGALPVARPTGPLTSNRRTQSRRPKPNPADRRGSRAAARRRKIGENASRWRTCPGSIAERAILQRCLASKFDRKGIGAAMVILVQMIAMVKIALTASAETSA
jgi:hypothetical protein